MTTGEINTLIVWRFPSETEYTLIIKCTIRSSHLSLKLEISCIIVYKLEGSSQDINLQTK